MNKNIYWSVCGALNNFKETIACESFAFVKTAFLSISKQHKVYFCQN
jgi:hypothetical protein